jgi:hypothetical protein
MIVFWHLRKKAEHYWYTMRSLGENSQNWETKISLEDSIQEYRNFPFP